MRKFGWMFGCFEFSRTESWTKASTSQFLLNAFTTSFHIGIDSVKLRYALIMKLYGLRRRTLLFEARNIRGAFSSFVVPLTPNRGTNCEKRQMTTAPWEPV